MKGQRVLDVGCGGGMLSESMAKAGAWVVGVDVSENALDVGRKHARQSALAINYLQAPAERLPFKCSSFHTVVAFDVLEHVSDLPMTLAEISRVLRPGGRFIYNTMNRTILCRVVVIWIGERCWKGGPPRGTHNWHKFIRPRELVELMARNGIANVETRGFAPVVADLHGRLQMRLVPFTWLSYVGWGVKEK